jgi:glycosyltransferase involved in cell wall biosynthesis
LLFVGRASPEKGPLDAIEIAKRTNLPLRMLIKVNEPLEHEYFESLRPHLKAPGIQVELEASEQAKEQAFLGAYATLFPVHWEEPFGLVMIESMAAGTPVIGYKRGAVPEVIEHGVSGFVCDTLEEAVAAVPLVVSLDREACRRHVATCYGAGRAVELHEALYQSLVGHPAK